MATAEYDLGYLEAATELLQNYLLSKEIYWKMNASSPPGEPRFPSLTLGAILLSQKRVAARDLTSPQKSRDLKVENKIEQVRNKWRTAWSSKAREEFRSRLDLWGNYLEEFRQDPQSNFDRFPYEVSRRVMLHLLWGETGGTPAAQEQMLVFEELLSSSLSRMTKSTPKVPSSGISGSSTLFEIWTSIQ